MDTTQQFTSVAFQLDANIIAKDIYAASALQFYFTDGASSRPAPLSPDQQGALNHIIHNAASFVLLSLLSHVEDLSLNSPDDPIILTTLKVSATAPITTIRRTLEMAIAAYAQHLVYSNSEYTSLTSTYRLQASGMVNDLKTLLGGNASPRLRPCLF